jgi:hypothetical protein
MNLETLQACLHFAALRLRKHLESKGLRVIDKGAWFPEWASESEGDRKLLQLLKGLWDARHQLDMEICKDEKEQIPQKNSENTLLTLWAFSPAERYSAEFDKCLQEFKESQFAG